MNEWELWRQDDNGARFRVRSYPDRVSAVAGRLMIESGLAHKQLYWVSGPRVPACRSLAEAADLVERLVDPAGPAWEAYVGAFRAVGASLRDDPRLDPDTVAAVFQAARDTVAGAGSAPDARPVPADGTAGSATARERRLVWVARRLRERPPGEDVRRQDLLDLVERAPS